MPADPMTSPPVHVRVVRFFEARPWLTDTVLKVLPLVLFSTVIWVLGAGAVTESGLFGSPVNPSVMFLLDLMAILPLAISRIRPGAAAGVIAFACLCQILAVYGPGMSAVAVPLVVHACAKYGSRRVSLLYLVTGLLGAVLLGVYAVLSAFLLSRPYDDYTPDWVATLFVAVLVTGFSGAVVLSAWLFGDLAGRRRREREAIEEKNALLERERDQEAKLAADAERMRIAREMHDVVSHSMGVMIAQADGGRYVLGQDPARAGRAFETIGETGREALAELRRMLGVLREEGELKKRPAPGVAELPRLVADVRTSGLDVDLRIDRESLPGLNEGVELVIYRIVQEALTNTLKHGGPGAAAEVLLGIDHHASELTLQVSDTGCGASAPDDGAGSGLLGMAERARLYGGTLTAGPKGAEPPAAGFVVVARFPLEHLRSLLNRKDAS